MSAGEFQYSAGFRMYPPNGGEAVYITVRSEVGTNDLLDLVETAVSFADGRGYTLKPNAGHQRRTPLDGVVLGQYTDAKTNSLKKSLHFYPASDNLQWKTGTLYPENFDKLPQWVVDAVRAAKTQPVIQAGDKATMRRQGVYITLPRPLIGVEEVMLDKDNNPVISEKTGKPIYKLVGFAGTSSGVGEPVAQLPPEVEAPVKQVVAQRSNPVVVDEVPF